MYLEKIAPFSKISGYMWTGPKSLAATPGEVRYTSLILVSKYRIIGTFSCGISDLTEKLLGKVMEIFTRYCIVFALSRQNKISVYFDDQLHVLSQCSPDYMCIIKGAFD